MHVCSRCPCDLRLLPEAGLFGNVAQLPRAAITPGSLLSRFGQHISFVLASSAGPARPHARELQRAYDTNTYTHQKNTCEYTHPALHILSVLKAWSYEACTHNRIETPLLAFARSRARRSSRLCSRSTRRANSCSTGIHELMCRHVMAAAWRVRRIDSSSGSQASESLSVACLDCESMMAATHRMKLSTARPQDPASFASSSRPQKAKRRRARRVP